TPTPIPTSTSPPPPIPSPTPPPIPTSTSPPPPIPSTTPTPIPTSTSPPPPIPSTTPTPLPTSTSPPQTIPSSTPPPIPTPTSPPPETEPPTDEHIYEEQSPVHHHFSPSQAQAPSHMPTDDLLQTVPNWRNLVLTDSEDEEPEAQGRTSQADPQDSSIQGLVTPPTTKAHASGEEQEEEISPNTLEAAKTLSKVASLKSRSIDKGRRYKRRKETKGKKVVSILDFQEEVDAGAEQVNTGSIKLSTGNEQVSTVGTKESTSSQDKGQREGKAPMISEETPKKLKEQILQEEARLAEAIRLDTLQKEEVVRQVHLDSLIAQRIAEEEEELNEQQKKRK
ncbi:hypothetical protein Tco_0062573, partial [Tanacetum coccineum]